MDEQDFTKLHTRARRHLARRDPIMKVITNAVGPCTLTPGGEPYSILVRSIVAQLISTAAARTISGRIETLCGGTITSETIQAQPEDRLRACGLSGAKVRAILDLTAHATDGRLPLERLGEMENEEILERLVAVRGIGVWTAEMFLIFGLGRPDVLPVGDLGLRAGVQTHYSLEELPKPAQVREIAEVWRPYRSIATWYLWRAKGAVPQS